MTVPTVRDAFDTLRQSLELTESEKKGAAAGHVRVREHLQKSLTLEDNFLSGSYKRHTSIRPLHDIDLFVVLKDDGRFATPAAAVRAVANAARGLDAKATSQDRSVGLVLGDIGFDAVPALTTNREGVYLIPDLPADRWIRTAPSKHREALTAANGLAGNKLVPLVKMLKGWNVQAGKPLRSFHLEVMASRCFKEAPTSYPEALATLFESLATQILDGCPDPAGVGPDIDERLSQSDRLRINKLLGEAGREAKRALGLAGEGKTEEAHGIWRSLLGTIYPEKGRPSSAAGGAAPLLSPDSPDRRFG